MTDKVDVLAPNCAMSIAPNGYIRVVFGYDLIQTSFYCDGQAARVLSAHFAGAADEYDKVWATINGGEEQLGFSFDGSDESEANGESDPLLTDYEIVEQFENDIEDEVAVSESPNEYN